MIDMDYIKAIISKYLRTATKNISHDVQLQKLYDSNYNISELLLFLTEYNLNQSVPYLASGMSCYFNGQADTDGISSFNLTEQDKIDAKYIASCFGKEINYSDNDLSVLYTTLLGTTELNYAAQTFPAGIFEDVFQCSSTHELPIQPIVGEREADYYVRVLEYQILQCKSFPSEKIDEVLYRGKRLANNFCNGKNRVYLIPFDNVLGNKVSFGDVDGLRDGKINGEERNRILNGLDTFETLLQKFNISTSDPYSNPNMTSEFGIAIYGTIPVKGLKFFEVDRVYELMQKKAKELGYLNGDAIPNDILSDNKGFSK